MKNFFKFLLVLVGVILLYIYNNPDVIDKYKTADGSTEKDSTQCVDTMVSDSQSINVSVIDSSKTDPLETDTQKTGVNLNTFACSPKFAKENLGHVDTAKMNDLMPYFKIIRQKNGLNVYHPKTAPTCLTYHDWFYITFGIENGEVHSHLYLNVNLSKEAESFDISKMVIVADDNEFDISSVEVEEDNEKGLRRRWLLHTVILDSEQYRDLTWALYKAKSVKVAYVNHGNPCVMAISDAQLEDIRRSVDMYIACGQWKWSKLGY
ncbi:MAG: hypothetical protein J6X12_05155 [Paludibacteraceae bacterium]|nr:hypothetical protein [Paludibacteraceae bacterium]